MVKDRILAFNELYPQGAIHTELLSDKNDNMVVFKATVYPDFNTEQDIPLNQQRYFTGYSQATWGEGMVNKTAAMENCETSAVGRALAFMGIGIIESVASADEVNKAITQPAFKPRTPAQVGKTVQKQEQKDDAEQDVLEFLNQDEN